MYRAISRAWHRPKGRFLNTSSLVVAFATSGALVLAPVAARAAVLPPPNCSVHNLQVAIADPGPADQTLWGQLCYRGQQEPRRRRRS